MRQVGWYDPELRSFISGGKDYSVHGTYSEPVFVDETPAMPPVKMPKDDDPFDEKLWHEIQLQTLENQCAILLEQMRNCENVETRHHLSEMRRNTIELLEKGRKSL